MDASGGADRRTGKVVTVAFVIAVWPCVGRSVGACVCAANL